MKALKSILLLLILSVMLISGCRRSERAYPPNAEIADSVMVSLLTDMFLIEGVMIQLEYLSAKSVHDAVPYYDVVYTKHNTNREQFLKTLKLYIDNPTYAEKLYDRVVLRLGEIESQK